MFAFEKRTNVSHLKARLKIKDKNADQLKRKWNLRRRNTMYQVIQLSFREKKEEMNQKREDDSF